MHFKDKMVPVHIVGQDRNHLASINSYGLDQSKALSTLNNLKGDVKSSFNQDKYEEEKKPVSAFSQYKYPLKNRNSSNKLRV